MTSTITSAGRVTTNANPAGAALVVTLVVTSAQLPAAQEPAVRPDEGGDDMHGTNAVPQEDPVAAFRDNRDRLDRIIGATVTAGTPAAPAYLVELRDHRGARLSLSGSHPGSQPDDPAWVLQVLLEAGFAPEVAAAVRTHRLVRLTRTSDGTTSLVRATSPQPAAVGTTGERTIDRRAGSGREASRGDDRGVTTPAQPREPDDRGVGGAALFPAAPARQAIDEFARRRRLTLAETAAQVNLDATFVQAVFHRRWIPWEAADAIAVALGHHPYDLWPEWFPPSPPSARAG